MPPAPAATAVVTPAATLAPPPTATPSAGQSTIRGAVFVDANRNGRREAGEVGLAGVSVELRLPNQSVLRSAVTNSQGAYSFEGLPPGRYVVVEIDPAGHTSTTLNSITVILRPGGLATVNFGDYPIGQ